ncbi:threonine synthase [Blattamonas nauphoetae]|uniref:Threonine synthase n=1 Tax=Blattamonas nauphoetae TaxID=2049346 RepID=A0ABQ9XAB6_9EUKA|nr:threonine synthase [Blattamonas nauphoetae]
MDFSCIKHLSCSVCKATASLQEAEETYVCAKCGGNFDFIYDYEKLKANLGKEMFGQLSSGMWRYRTLLPLQKEAQIPQVIVGGTPLHHISEKGTKMLLGEAGDGIDLFLKDEGRNPTGSLKDRASALVASKALFEKKPVVCTASTGNAAAALAGVCASLGMPCVIFVPAAAPVAKIAQLRAFGAYVFLVDGVYDDAFELCLECVKRFGWYCRSTGYNAFTSEGKKSVSFEICEQLAGYVIVKKDAYNPGAVSTLLTPARSTTLRPISFLDGNFVAPDWIAVSVGDGNIISGIWSGICDLFELGLINKKPKMLAVQSEGSQYVYQALQKGKTEEEWHKMAPIESSTVADSIEANLPRDRVRACRAVRDSGGVCVTVTDDEILREIPVIGQATGVFVEPASACTMAGVKKAIREKLLGEYSAEKVLTLVCVMTGAGLKDVGAAERGVAMKKIEGFQPGSAVKVAVSVDAVATVVKDVVF